jgi:hypothetical protein
MSAGPDFELGLSELAQAETAVTRARERCYQSLGAALTRKNFADVLHKHCVRISSGWEELSVDYLGVVHPGVDWRNLTRSHDITVYFGDASSSHRTIIEQYMAQLWPHALILYRRHEIEVKLVSKSKFQDAKNIKVSDIEEDGINAGLQYLAYILYHNIRGARWFWLDLRRWAPNDDFGDTHRERCDRIAGAMYRDDEDGDLGKDMDSALTNWSADYRASMWCNLHYRLLELCLALAPLRLTPYELLWILDYVPPMSFLCYREGIPYDPNHTLKLRLFESVAASYWKIKAR